MAVTLVGSAPVSGIGYTVVRSYTVGTGTDRCLIVASWLFGNTLNGISYAGAPMTAMGSNGTDKYVHKLPNAAPGANNMQFVFANYSQIFALTSDWSGVHQSDSTTAYTEVQTGAGPDGRVRTPSMECPPDGVIFGFGATNYTTGGTFAGAEGSSLIASLRSGSGGQTFSAGYRTDTGSVVIQQPSSFGSQNAFAFGIRASAVIDPLLAPRKLERDAGRTKQPQGALRLNQSNQFAKKLAAAIVYGGEQGCRAWANGQAIPTLFNSSGIIHTSRGYRYGVGVTSNSMGDADFFSALMASGQSVAGTITGQRQTWVFVGKLITGQANQTINRQDLVGDSFQKENYNGTGCELYSCGGMWRWDWGLKDAVIVVTRDSSSLSNMPVAWVNGVRVTVSQVTPATSTQHTDGIISTPSGGNRQADAVYGAAMLFNDLVDDSFAMAMYDNPWHIFQPIKRNFRISIVQQQASVTRRSVVRRVPRTRQPQTISHRSNPASKGLVALYNGATGFDEAGCRRIRAYNFGTSSLLGPQETRILSTNGLQYRIGSESDSPGWGKPGESESLGRLTPSQSLTFIALNYFDSSDVYATSMHTGFSAVGYNLGFRYSTANPYHYVRTTGGAFAVESGTPSPKDKWHTQALVFDRQTNQLRGYSDGDLFQTVATSGDIDYVTGQSAFEGFRLYKPTAMFAVFDHALSDVEMKRINENPWQLFTPIKRTITAATTVVSITRPSSDVTVSGWTTTEPTYYGALNELVFDDLSYISSPNIQGTTVYQLVVGISPSLSVGNYDVSIRLRSNSTTKARILLLSAEDTVVGTSEWQNATGTYSTYILPVTATSTATKLKIEVCNV